MLVYHASNMVVVNPMPVESNRLLDFGPGFYTTTNREPSEQWLDYVAENRAGKYAGMRYDLCEANMIAAVDEYIDKASRGNT